MPESVRANCAPYLEDDDHVKTQPEPELGLLSALLLKKFTAKVEPSADRGRFKSVTTFGLYASYLFSKLLFKL